MNPRATAAPAPAPAPGTVLDLDGVRVRVARMDQPGFSERLIWHVLAPDGRIAATLYSRPGPADARAALDLSGASAPPASPASPPRTKTDEKMTRSRKRGARATARGMQAGLIIPPRTKAAKKAKDGGRDGH